MTISTTGSFQDAVDAVFVSVDPADTYLHTNLDPSAGDALAINLAGLGFSAGMLIELNPIFLTFDDDGNPGTPEVIPETMGGVFSSSSTINASASLNRIPGAIAPANDFTPFVSQNTATGNHTTDITQDFLLGEDLIEIPTGGDFLFWDDLVAWLLDVDHEIIHGWTNGKRTFDVPTPNVPVFITYLTAFPEDDGRLEHFEDIYSREQNLSGDGESPDVSSLTSEPEFAEATAGSCAKS